MVSDILNLLESVIGTYSRKSKGNVAFHCPFCNHAKRKLEVQTETYAWQCWVCGAKGRSLYTLLKRAGASKAQLDRLQSILPKKRRKSVEYTADVPKICKLPDSFIPLWKPNRKNFFWNTCMEYLQSRGVTLYDILKYRIGYCTSGRYKNMIVFPNYNKDGQLTYYTTRSFMRSNSAKFINPPLSRNIVGFELQLNWELPVILVESALDAITIKRNASPLYGTVLSKALKGSIIENGVKKLYLALDYDALSKSIDIARYLMNLGISVHFVKLENGTDPNSLGYEKMWNLINSTEELTEDELFDYTIKKSLFV